MAAHRTRAFTGFLLLMPLVIGAAAQASPIMAAGKSAQLDIRAVTDRSLRITVKPLDDDAALPDTPILTERNWPPPAISLRDVDGVLNYRLGALYVIVQNDPLTIDIGTGDGRIVQHLVFTNDGSVTFRIQNEAVLGLGEGVPVSAGNERDKPPEFDRRGRLYEMTPGALGKALDLRNPVPLLIGTSGWALFVHAPWVEVDLRDRRRGIFVPRATPPSGEIDDALLQGRPPPDSVAHGLFDLFVFDASEPTRFMNDLIDIAGRAVMPPKWALGYLVPSRTRDGDAGITATIDALRAKEIPVDAAIAGSGTNRQGRNSAQAAAPEVPASGLADIIRHLHQRRVHAILPVALEQHPPLRLHGNIPPRSGETVDAGHIETRWSSLAPLLEAGGDGFRPAEGDELDLFSRIARHRMFYQGPLATTPDTRPFSLHQNGYLGIARRGGWMWSGAANPAWQTLAAAIPVGLNQSLSLSPYWGPGSPRPQAELTGELYARWFQFAAFTPCFCIRAEKENPQPADAGNPAIEKIVRKYTELRYRLLPYNYTLAWQARVRGMPLMRALWLQYPYDKEAARMGNEYLWGRDLLIAPVVEKGAATRDIYLPEGLWYGWWTDVTHTGGTTITREVDLETLPIYVRAGAIVPVDPVRQYAAQRVYEPTRLKVYRGQNGVYTLYDDDGSSLDYLDGEMSRTRITWDDRHATLTLEPAGPGVSARQTASHQFAIELIPGGDTRRVSYIGQRVSVNFGDGS